jgi:hypothetical protein
VPPHRRPDLERSDAVRISGGRKAQAVDLFVPEEKPLAYELCKVTRVTLTSHPNPAVLAPK